MPGLDKKTQKVYYPYTFYLSGTLTTQGLLPLNCQNCISYFVVFVVRMYLCPKE